VSWKFAAGVPAATVLALSLTACLAPRPWWEKELNAWKGATTAEVMDAWGPPVRTITDKEGRPTLVYESFSVIDESDEELLNPNIVLQEDRPVARSVEERECTMLLITEGDVVVDTDARGAGCAVPRRSARQ
jgi:hypothetical protein